jgi:flagellar biosynthesis anti-sigma factor FlgM
MVDLGSAQGLSDLETGGIAGAISRILKERKRRPGTKYAIYGWTLVHNPSAGSCDIMAKIEGPPPGKNNLSAYLRPAQSATREKIDTSIDSKRKFAAAAETKAPTDQVSISAEARRLQAIARDLQSLPSQSERDQKVEALRRAVKEGRYSFDAAKVAERMLQSLLDDSE